MGGGGNRTIGRKPLTFGNRTKVEEMPIITQWDEHFCLLSVSVIGILFIFSVLRGKWIQTLQFQMTYIGIVQLLFLI